MADPETPDDFQRRLDAAQAERAGRKPKSAPVGSVSMGPGMKVGIDFGAAIIVGLFIGWVLDRWLDTRPWMMILFFFLGSAAGGMSVYRAMEKLGKKG